MVNEKAKRYVELNEKLKEIKKEMGEIEKDYLIPHAKTIHLLEDKKQIIYTAPKGKYDVDNDALYNHLFVNGKTEVIKKFFSVSKTSMEKDDYLKDHVNSYMKKVGESKPSISVKSMSKKLIEELQND